MLAQIALLTLEMLRRTNLFAYLALLSVCFFWGTTYVGIRIALEGLPPALLVSVRYWLSGGILLTAALLRGMPLPRGRELLVAIGSGILVLGIGNGFLAFAEQTVPSGLASLFVTTSPFWLVGIEAVWGGERLHWPTLGGMAVGFCGTALLVAPGGVAVDRSMWIGFVLLQIGIIGWCFGSIFQRRSPSSVHPLVTAGVQQLTAGLLYLPVMLLLPHHPAVWSARVIWAVIYLVIFGSLVGYSGYIIAMNRLPVSIVSVYPYVNSVVAVWLGWLFYREAFGLREFISMLIIFAGVGIVKWQGSRRAL